MYKLHRQNSLLNQDRQDWYNQRKNVEESLSNKSKRKRKRIQKLAQIFPICLFDFIGKKNTLKIKNNKVSFGFKNLPPSFDGFSLLHISDPHFGAHPLLDEAICEAVSQAQADLIVLTGDYQFGYGSPPQLVFDALKKLKQAFSSPLPALAILGNHDRTEMVRRVEDEDFIFLTNELVSIKNKQEEIFIYGIDEALLPQHFNKPINQFGICLGHSVEYAKPVAENGWDFMLAGHSHGGQICLPFGVPIFLSIDFNRHIAIESWTEFGMKGYTSKGCGVSTLPWRWNCAPQITIINLERI